MNVDADLLRKKGKLRAIGVFKAVDNPDEWYEHDGCIWRIGQHGRVSNMGEAKGFNWKRHKIKERVATQGDTRMKKRIAEIAERLARRVDLGTHVNWDRMLNDIDGFIDQNLGVMEGVPELKHDAAKARASLARVRDTIQEGLHSRGRKGSNRVGSSDSLEDKARAFGKSWTKVQKALHSARGLLHNDYRSKFKDATFDKGKRRMVSADGTMALQWMLRSNPDKPIDYNNQQTSVGTVVLVTLKGRKASITPTVSRMQPRT